MGQGGSFGIISAYGPGPKSENKRRHGELIADLQRLGYRKFSDLKGSWEGVSEKSLIIPDIKPEHLFELGRKYGQDSVIYKSRKGVVGMYYPKAKKVTLAMDPKGDPAFESALDKGQYSKERNWSFSLGFVWGKDIPWDGKSVLGKDYAMKALGIKPGSEGPAQEDHKPGDVWKTPQGNWRAMNNKGDARSFDTQEEASAYAH